MLSIDEMPMRSALKIKLTHLGKPQNDFDRPRWRTPPGRDVPVVREIGPWASVPPSQRSIVHAYINSVKEVDIERAHALCDRYDLDYEYMRALILKEMVDYEAKRLARPGVTARHF